MALKSTGLTRQIDRGTPLLSDLLIGTTARCQDKVALVCGKRRLTYREIDAQSDAFANALVQRGVQRGDRVVLFQDNTVEAVIAFWGTLKANAVVSMVNPLTKVNKLGYLLNDCRAAALITEANLAPVAGQAARSSPHLRCAVVVGDPGRADFGRIPVAAWGAALASESGRHRPARTCIEVDLASIIYTSGSTGEPKGVMLTHRNMLAASTSISAYLEIAESEVILGVLPLAFDYGLYQMIMAFQAGARLVLERSFAYPAQVLKVVAEEKVTGFPGVPTMFAILAELKSRSTFDFSAIRYVTNTAAALPVKHILALRGIFPGAKIFSMYGLTECKRCSYLPPEDLDRKPTSVGLAIPNTELWIVDEEDNRVGSNQVGQLVVRGPTVMKGYWERPAETAEKLRPGLLPGEQVLYTGDYCRFDEDGYLYFVGRMDDIIKSRGEKVPPKEVESAIVDVPGVKEAAVIGIDDEVLGQALKAFVVLEAGAMLTERDIQKQCQQRLESFMVPKYVVFLSELPKTNTGKVKKGGLA